MSDLLVDPRSFLARLPLSAKLDDWQRRDLDALSGGLQVCAGVKPTYPVYQRAYLERPRGHSKTTDLSRLATWPLLAARQPIRGAWASGDKGQADLGLAGIARLCHEVPLIGRCLEITRNQVRNVETGSVLEFLTSDAPTSWGQLLDLILIDELTHWTEGAEHFWHSMFSTAAKKPNCLLAIISNAGFTESWQAKVAQAAQESPTWYYSRLDGPQASWITPELLEEQRKFLPEAVYRRVWLNEWSSGAGDALQEEDVRAAVRPREDLSPLFGGRPQTLMIAAVDIGVRRDHSALMAVVADLDRQLVHHVHSESWAPPVGGKVELAEVELAIEQLAWEYPYCNFVADPWQAESMIQRLRAKGIRIKEFPATPKNLSNWATSLVAAFVNRQVTLLPDDPALVAQLLKLRIVENPVGFKLQAPRDRVHGHCDKAVAFSMALGEAMLAMMNHVPYIDDGLGDSVLDYSGPSIF